MKNLSIRGVDDKLASALRQRAAESKKSINQLALEALRAYLQLNKTQNFTNEHHDLDGLFGAWSESEYQEIQGAIDSIRAIDDEVWK